MAAGNGGVGRRRSLLRIGVCVMPAPWGRGLRRALDVLLTPARRGQACGGA
jgi:hypothetical protein